MFEKQEGDMSKQPSITIIAEGSLIKGSISVTSDFRLAGNIDGDVSSEGKCIIASTATVLGNIISPDSDIAGTVTGNLMVNQKLVLRKTAFIKGEIRTKVIMVEEGARVEGTIVMSRNGG
jgi:cytoskeletal protein CcmA (bactofilin family)